MVSENANPSLDPPVKEKRGLLFRISSAIENAMRTTFFRLGFFVAGRPIATILVMVALALLCLIGMLRFQSESRADKLWVPQNTVALANLEYVRARFGQTVRLSNIVFAGKKDDSNLASKDAMLEMLAVAEAGFKVETKLSTTNSTKIKYPERCIRTADIRGNSLCFFSSAAELFYDPTNPIRDSSKNVDFFATVRRSLEKKSNEAVREQLEKGPFVSVSGTPFNEKDIIGGKSGSGASFSIKSFRFSQFADSNAIVVNGENVDEENDAWEEAWTARLLSDKASFKTKVINWEVESTFSQQESLSQALSGDLPLFSVGFCLLTAFVILYLGDFHAVRSRQVLGVVALFNAGLSLGATFGLSSAFGMFFGPVHQVLPLLIIGIGVDDVFVVTRALDEVNQSGKYTEKSARVRIALALSNAGSAITVTSVTNTIVFLLGSITKLPALRYFALWAAIGVLLDWLFTVTFYTAALTLDTRRQDAKRRDCCPFLRPVAEVKELNWFKKRPGGFSRFFENQFGPLIMRRIVRLVLLSLFLGLLGVCIWGCTQLYLKFNFTFFYPAGSDQRKYQDIVDKYYKVGLPARIYLAQTNHATPVNQRRYLKLCDPENGVIAKNRFIQENTVDCWYTSFRKYKGITGDNVVDPSNFDIEVQRFINSNAGKRFKRDIKFLKSGKIESSRFSGLKVYAASNKDEIDALESIRRAADSVGFGRDAVGNPKAFTYIFQDTFTEQYRALPGEIAISLGLAMAAVAVICFLLVGHPLVGLTCVVVVGMIIVDVLGFTYFTGVNINSVSVITIVIATGIAVDYVVHIARAFLEQVGTRNERAIKALGSMGPPVFYAGFSTFLAIIVLAFATSYIFNVIFLGFLELILIGLAHGIILSPIILSLLGPRSFFDSSADKESSEMKLIEKLTTEVKEEQHQDEMNSSNTV